MRKVLVIPDVHFPWHHQPTLTWIYEQIKQRKPDIVVQAGDLLDCFSSSKFARSHNVMTPEQEFKEGRLGSEAMWRNVQSAAPKAKCYQLRGNHDVRPDKRILERCPEVQSLLNIKPLFEFKGVTTLMDAAEALEIDGNLYIHGHLGKLGDHLNYFGASVVHGHLHRGGSIFKKMSGRVLWELDCGFASDEEAIPMRYGPTRRTHWTLGCGFIDECGPRFLMAPDVKLDRKKI